MPKVHKDMDPFVTFWPVISQGGAFSWFILRFVDYKLQQLSSCIPSMIIDSIDFIQQLQARTPFPAGVRIFTSDAKSMYTNIDAMEGIIYMQRFFQDCVDIPMDEELKLLIRLLNLIMHFNIFKFGNTWWRQLSGTAMDTPVAVIYAMVFFAYFENTLLLKKYQKNILFYKNQVDDIFCVWQPTAGSPTAYEEFKKDLNSQCKLKWKTTKLGIEENFLDLTVRVLPNRMVETRTYQKPNNLFLYITAHSSHPPGLLKSLIFGLLQTYKAQNTWLEDFLSTTELLFDCLLDQ